MRSVAKKTLFIRASLLSLMIILAIALTEAEAQVSSERILLVDFGASAAENQYEIDGWNTPIVGPYTDYTTIGPGGTTQVSGADKYDSYQGVRGTPREFVYGERIIVTWYNNSNEKITFRPLISFEDQDNPNGSEGEPQWYPMQALVSWGTTSIAPYSTAQTAYDIADGSQYHSYPVSTGTYTVVNVCPNMVQTNKLIVDKIEISNNEVDNIKPTVPGNLQVSNTSDTSVSLVWDASSDNEKVDKYFVYRDGELEAVSTETSFTDYYLTPQTGYTYTVTAHDTNRNESDHSNEVTVTTQVYQEDPDHINPWKGIEYVGAFKLPRTDGGTWQYSLTGRCSAMAYYPYPNGNYPEDKDSGGMDDGYPGSLFAVGNCGGFGIGRVAEISIPQPVNSKNLDELNTAAALQPFADVRAFELNVQIATSGLEYLPAQGTQQTDKLYHFYGEFFVMSDSHTKNKPVTHGATELTLNNPQPQGGWRIGSKGESPEYDEYVFLDLFGVPKEWADAHTGGRMLITGRSSRTGARVGDSMYAIGPWIDSYPEPLPADQSMTDDYLSYVTLIHYDVTGSRTRNEFNHTDSFHGGSWITAGNKSAVILSGNKVMGETWYGLSDGSPPGLLENHVPSLHSSELGGKGWKSTATYPLIVFYDPKDLAKVAHGEMEPWEPQPYAGLDVSAYMIDGKNTNLGAVSFDSQNGLLYAVEGRAGGDYPVIHVFKVGDISTYTLSVNKAGDGQGMVTSSPAGIDCGDSCSTAFKKGTTLRLTATAESGSEFMGWSGADCSGTEECVVTMDQAQVVTATFSLLPVFHSLTITKAGDGTGTVTSTPAGIECGTTCSAEYEEGTEVMLTAVADPGSIFEGWSVACGGIEDCVVTLDEAQAVIATFEPDDGDVLIFKEQSLEFDRGGAASSPFVYRGDIISYAITATNLFEEAITLMISDSLSALVDYVAGTLTVNREQVADTYFSNEGLLEYTSDPLNKNEFLTIAFDVMVKDDAIFDEVIENFASVTANFIGSPDPIISNKLSNTVSAHVKDQGMASTPEPSTFIFFAIGLSGVAFIRWRRQRNKK